MEKFAETGKFSDAMADILESIDISTNDPFWEKASSTICNGEIKLPGWAEAELEKLVAEFPDRAEFLLSAENKQILEPYCELGEEKFFELMDELRDTLTQEFKK